MNAHDWFVENRTAFVGGGLDADEHRSFLEHLDRCPECARAVATLDRELAWLPMGVAPVAPRPGFSRTVLERVLHGRRGWRGRVGAIAAAAALLLAAGVWGVGRQERAALRADLAAAEQRYAALQDTLSIIQGAGRIIHARIAMQQYQGAMLIFDDPVTHRWNVVVHGLPEAPAGEVYQLWFVTETGLRRAAEVRCDGKRPAFVTLEMPDAATRILGAVLTMEAESALTTDAPQGMRLANVEL